MTPVPPLPADDVARLTQTLPLWTGTSMSLERSILFPSFAAAIGFMQAGVDAIDRLNHHPEWTNIYNRIAIRLRTHDAGDRVTALDVTLAHALDALALQHRGR